MIAVLCIYVMCDGCFHVWKCDLFLLWHMVWDKVNWTELHWNYGISVTCDCVSSSSLSADWSPPTCSSCCCSPWLQSATCQVRTHMTSSPRQPCWNSTCTMSLGMSADLTDIRWSDTLRNNRIIWTEAGRSLSSWLVSKHFASLFVIMDQTCWSVSLRGCCGLLRALCSSTLVSAAFPVVLLTDFSSLTDSHHVSISADAQTYFTTSATANISACPITFYGRVYKTLYVSKMNRHVWTAVCLCPRWSFVSVTMLHFYSETIQCINQTSFDLKCSKTSVISTEDAWGDMFYCFRLIFLPAVSLNFVFWLSWEKLIWVDQNIDTFIWGSFSY